MLAMKDLSHGVRRAASSVNSGSKLSKDRLDFCNKQSLISGEERARLGGARSDNKMQFTLLRKIQTVWQEVRRSSRREEREVAFHTLLRVSVHARSLTALSFLDQWTKARKNTKRRTDHLSAQGWLRPSLSSPVAGICASVSFLVK